MSIIDRPGQGQTPQPAPEPIRGAAGWAAGIVGVALAAGWIVSLFAFAAASFWLLGALIAFAILVGNLVAAAARKAVPGEAKLGHLLLILSPIWAGIAGLFVFWPHLISFAFAAWVTLALYVAGVLSILRFLSPFWRFAGIATAIAIGVAIVVLPPPNGAFAADDEAHSWRVVLTVVDARGDPIPGAGAICIPRVRWAEHELPGFFASTAQRTDGDGRAEFSFTEDTRMKVVLCGAALSGDSTEWRAEPKWVVTGTPLYGDAAPVRISFEVTPDDGPY